MNPGIIFALIAIVAWGFGDFLIQKTDRLLDTWQTLFYITAFGSLALLPFIWTRANNLQPHDLASLLFTSLVLLGAALLDMRALTVGKLSVVEPIFTLEIPVVTIIAMFFIHEFPSLIEILLICGTFFGIRLLTARNIKGIAVAKIERGVFIAFMGMLAMSATNFLFGVGGREFDALMVNWFSSVIIFTASIFALWKQNTLPQLFKSFKKRPSLIMSVAVFDNAAWIAYTYTMIYMPIALATGITESYVAITALLGIYINKEHLRRHQVWGLVITILCAIILSFLVA